MSKELQIKLSRRLMRRYNYNVYRKRKYETVKYRRYKKPSNNFLDLIYKMWTWILMLIGTIIYYVCVCISNAFNTPPVSSSYSYCWY